MNAQTRKATNLSLNRALLEEARELGVNLSRSAEEGVRAAVKAEKERVWKEENRDKLDAINKWVEENGLPLAQFRQF